MHIKLNKLPFWALIFTTVLLKAQTDFRSGYIIKTNGDTLYGEIDYRNDLLMSRICKFKDIDNQIVEYYPNDIKAFRFINSKYYVSREINKKKVFLEYLIKGKINIYYMRDDIGDHYYLDNDETELIEMPYEEGIKYVGDTLVFYQTKKHIGLLTYYMKDAPRFQQKINSVKKPEHHSLIKLAEDYHNAVCEGEKCIIYEKRKPVLKINMEVIAGIVNFENGNDIIDKYYLQSGVLLHFWMPRSNEKLYFKTGFLYSQVENTDGKKYGSIRIPTHIGYFAPKTYRIRPSFSIGLFTPSYSGGVAIRVNKNINFGVQGWVNFFSSKIIPIIPKEIFNYSILGNIYIEL